MTALQPLEYQGLTLYGFPLDRDQLVVRKCSFSDRETTDQDDPLYGFVYQGHLCVACEKCYRLRLRKGIVPAWQP